MCRTAGVKIPAFFDREEIDDDSSASELWDTVLDSFLIVLGSVLVVLARLSSVLKSASIDASGSTLSSSTSMSKSGYRAFSKPLFLFKYLWLTYLAHNSYILFGMMKGGYNAIVARSNLHRYLSSGMIPVLSYRIERCDTSTAALSDCTSQIASNWLTRSPGLTCHCVTRHSVIPTTMST